MTPISSSVASPSHCIEAPVSSVPAPQLEHSVNTCEPYAAAHQGPAAPREHEADQGPTFSPAELMKKQAKKSGKQGSEAPVQPRNPPAK